MKFVSQKQGRCGGMLWDWEVNKGLKQIGKEGRW